MKIDFKKKVLKNGMTILFEKRDLPIVSVAFAVRQGGIHEDPSEKGISHFIEHMLYKGTPKRNNNQKIAEEIERNGGDLNGFTSETITAYWCKMPCKHLNVALDVLADMVKNPLFDEEEFEKERKVIFEEIKMYHDNPRAHAFEEIQKNLYSGTMGIPLIGTEETMGSITREDMVKKFKEIYTPNNLILTVVGDADFSEIVDFCEKNFGNEKGKISIKKFSPKNSSTTEKRKGVDQANLVYAYHVPTSDDKKSFAAEILNTIIAGGFCSRLFTEIRSKRNLAYAVKGNSDINKDFAFNYIYVGTTKENVEKVKEIIINEFEELSKNLTAAEVEQVKEQMIGNYHISMEDSQSQMVNLLHAECDGDAKDFYDYQKNISKVKLEDVKALAKQAAKKFSFFALLPE